MTQTHYCSYSTDTVVDYGRLPYRRSPTNLTGTIDTIPYNTTSTVCNSKLIFSHKSSGIAVSKKTKHHRAEARNQLFEEFFFFVCVFGCFEVQLQTYIFWTVNTKSSSRKENKRRKHESSANFVRGANGHADRGVCCGASRSSSIFSACLDIIINNTPDDEKKKE